MEIKLEQKPGYTIVNCATDLTGEKAEELKKVILDNMASLHQAIVLNLKGCTAVDHAFLRAIASVGKVLKEKEKRLMAVNVSHNVSKFIKSNGLDSVIKIVASMQEVAAMFKAAPKIDVNFIKPFIQGAVDVLRIQCSFAAHAGKPFLKGQGSEISTDIAAVIGLTSRAFNGSVAICFPQNIFLTLMSNMLGEKYKEITRDLEDGAAELLNIIFSQAKTVLNEKGYAIERAIPTIVRGRAIAVRHLTPEVTIVLPFETNMGVFHVEVAIEAPEKSA